MERLTKRLDDGYAVMRCEECKARWREKHGTDMESCTAVYCRNRCKDRLAAYEDSGFTPAEIKSLYAEWDVMMSVLNSIGGGYTRLRELAEADRDGRVIITDTTNTDIDHDGLKLKYRVYKAENNAPVENCFVLRPMKDRAARIAMEAYAKATENKELSKDIFDVLKILACS